MCKMSPLDSPEMTLVLKRRENLKYLQLNAEIYQQYNALAIVSFDANISPYGCEAVGLSPLYLVMY